MARSPGRRSTSLRNALLCTLATSLLAAQAQGETPNAASAKTVAQTIYLALRNPADAEAYARAVQTPGDPSYHRFLSRDAFVQRFAPTDADLTQVESALTQAGYTIGTVFANHLAIEATSSAAAAEAALGVTLKQVTEDGNTGLVPEGTITLPPSIRSLVRGVGGLDTVHLPQPQTVSSEQATETVNDASTVLPRGIPGRYLPQDFASRYGVDPIYRNGFRGKGTTIGIVTLANFHHEDAYAFWKAIGLNVAQDRLTKVDVNGGTSIAANSKQDEGESDIDVEESGGVAPDAKIRVYVSRNTSTTDHIDAFEMAASENIADTVSSSWSSSELNFYANPASKQTSRTFMLDAFHDVFLEMGIQGQSVFVASGDSGAFNTVRKCPVYGTPSAKTPVCNAPFAVGAPSSDPAVTSTGGTTLPFTLTMKDGDVLAVTQEQAWSRNYIYKQTMTQPHPKSLQALFSGGGGGGVSTYFALPSYQQGVAGITATMPNQTYTRDTGSGPVTQVTLPANFAGRNLPDLSADADPNTGYAYIMEGKTVTGHGGTSFVAPQFNAVTALAVQSLGGRVGLLNTIVYGLGAQGSDDIAAGDNWGYQAGAGYDNASGLGVLNAIKLAGALLQLKARYGR